MATESKIKCLKTKQKMRKTYMKGTIELQRVMREKMWFKI